jgi:hypothetical protein
MEFIKNTKELKNVVMNILCEYPSGIPTINITEVVEDNYELPKEWFDFNPTTQGYKILKEKGIIWKNLSKNEKYYEMKILGSNKEFIWKHNVRNVINDLNVQGYLDKIKIGEDDCWKLNEKGKNYYKNLIITDTFKNKIILTPKANDINEIEDTIRIETSIYRILRDTPLARNLKKIYNDSCQICGKVIKLNNNYTYSEAHHIKPLGKPHNGPDVMENILILCPDHHVLCDYGAITLSIEKLRVHQDHKINIDYIDYHNNIKNRPTTDNSQ